MESSVGLGTINITCGKLLIYNTLGTGRPFYCPRGTEKADGRWVGPHHSEEQWPQDEGSTWQIRFSPLRKFPENPGGIKGLSWNATEGAFQAHSYCAPFFLIMEDNGTFSLPCSFTTQFQLLDHLAKGTPKKKSFDIDSKLFKKILKNANSFQQCP